MKKYFAILVLFFLATRVIAGEIPSDFLKSDNHIWNMYFKEYLVFPESRITLKSFVHCLQIPHVSTRWNDPDPDLLYMNRMISLSATKLLSREALWELKQQTGCDITASEDNSGTLLINFPKKDTLK